MKVNLLISRQRIEENIDQMTVGEKLLFFEGEESRLAVRNIVARFMCDTDNKPISFTRAKLILNALSDNDLSEAYSSVADKIMGLAVPPESASAS